ncbi:MAG: hypothetical protein K8F59_06745 [Rhodobacteraceae bacterium]|nr:hypothetical protein [Paracoccaceae bacterium]
MSLEWMIEVLTDLKNFARANGLTGLAEQLDDSILIAAADLKQNARKEAASKALQGQEHRGS